MLLTSRGEVCLSSQDSHQLAAMMQTSCFLSLSLNPVVGRAGRERTALPHGCCLPPHVSGHRGAGSQKEAWPAVTQVRPGEFSHQRHGPSLQFPALPTQGTSRGRSSEETQPHARMPGPHGTPFLVSMPRYVLGHKVLSALYLFTEREVMVSTL